jgi:hypothetical protein
MNGWGTKEGFKTGEKVGRSDGVETFQRIARLSFGTLRGNKSCIFLSSMIHTINGSHGRKQWMPPFFIEIAKHVLKTGDKKDAKLQAI